MQDRLPANLSRFYQGALLTPELLCLSCSESAWNRPEGCSEQKRRNCALYLSDMAGRINPRPADPPRIAQRPPAPAEGRPD